MELNRMAEKAGKRVARDFADGEPSTDPGLSKAQWEVIEICVRASQVLGAPRSVGEIFGFLFTKNRAVSFEQVVTTLGISAGSASQGLRHLRRLGVVKVVLRARDRRDYFQIENSLKRILTGFVSETAAFHLGGVVDRIDKLKVRVKESECKTAPEVVDRLNVLLEWSQQTRSALAFALEAIP
jgi:DNA-binding transcriptional regulator GbsR (MarR family)